MSTINSYFNTRKSRHTKADNKNKNEQSIVNHFAAQAPQPVYDEVKKPITVVSSKKQDTKKKNSILYYLSPVTKSRDTNVEAEIVETPLPCRIRSIIPVLTIWNEILEEFDPTSHTNQLTQDSPLSIPEHELTIENMDIIHNNKATRRRLEEEEDMTRNVRIRTQPTVFCLEDHLLEDIKEDLSRPLRAQYSLNQTNTFLIEMIDEFLYFL